MQLHKQSCVFACVFTDCANYFQEIISKRKRSCLLCFLSLQNFFSSLPAWLFKNLSLACPTNPRACNYCHWWFLFLRLTCPSPAWVLYPPREAFQHCCSYPWHCFTPSMLGNAPAPGKANTNAPKQVKRHSSFSRPLKKILSSFHNLLSGNH